MKSMGGEAKAVCVRASVWCDGGGEFYYLPFTGDHLCYRVPALAPGEEGKQRELHLARSFPSPVTH